MGEAWAKYRGHTNDGYWCVVNKMSLCAAVLPLHYEV